MKDMARTIDNLGIDSSTRYARDEEQRSDKDFLKDVSIIPQQTKIAATITTHPSEFDRLFGLGERGTEWGSSSAPSNFATMRRPIFSQELIPSLGPLDIRETQVEKLQSMPTSTEESAQEKNAFLKLFSEIENLNRQLLDIKACCGQYQKG